MKISVIKSILEFLRSYYERQSQSSRNCVIAL